MTEKNFWTCGSLGILAIAAGTVGSMVHTCVENHKTNKAIRKSIEDETKRSIEKKERLEATLADLEAQMVAVEEEHKQTQRKVLKEYQADAKELKNRLEDIFGPIDDQEEDDGLE